MESEYEEMFDDGKWYFRPFKDSSWCEFNNIMYNKKWARYYAIEKECLYRGEKMKEAQARVEKLKTALRYALVIIESHGLETHFHLPTIHKALRNDD